MIQLTEMVVTKGRTVIHDGKTYEQHSRVRLPEDEAERLQVAGFVMPLSTVRQALHDDAGDEKHDVGSGESDDHNSDGSGGDTSGGVGNDEQGCDVDTGGQNVVSAAAVVKNNPGRPKKGAK